MGLSFFSLSFSVDAIRKYQLSLLELTVIDWLLNFMTSTHQESKTKPTGSTYYWVKTSKITSDLDWLGCHPNSMGLLLQRLIKKGVLEKWDTSVRNKRRIYYKFNDIPLNELKGRTMNKLVAMPDDVSSSKKKYRTLHPEVITILDELNDIETIGKDEETKTLFSFTKKAYENGESKFEYMKKFNQYCLDLYDGKFTRHKYPWTDDFLAKNAWCINEEKNQARIRACKGNWDKVKRVIISAAIHYERWFYEESGHATFARKNTNIGSWMYDSFNGTSLFYACIQNVVPIAKDIMQTKIADELVNELPDVIYVETKKLTHSLFSSCNNVEDAQIWIAIKKVYELECLIRKTYKSDHRVATYLGPPAVWTIEYLQWLPTCWGPSTDVMLKPYHVGIKGKPWKDYLRSNVDLMEVVGLDTLVDLGHQI